MQGGEIWLRGLVGSPDGTQMIRDEIRGPLAEGEALGHALAQRLLADGADVILAEVYRA
ncbi:Porphobilinogen deaminase [compost metagenome]